jgi:chromosome segregation ATPase
MVNTIGYLCE